MIDVHCHLNFKSFIDDFDSVIKQAKQDGVDTIINVGTQISSSQRAVELANQYENLYAIVGVHPHHADKVTRFASHPEPRTSGEGSPEDWITELELLTKQPKVVAIGECGMDFYSYQSNGIVDPEIQKDVFVKQIELAGKVGLPLQIHNRHAGKEILTVLNEHKNLLHQTPPGMFHCFAGNMEILHEALDLGFYIGFDGNITYKGLAPGEDTKLSDLAKETPLDRIVIETDSPYLTPEPHRGSRNIPSYAIIVAECIASIKGVSAEEIRGQTTENARTLFHLPSLDL